jgi:hypothetical protein
VYVCVCARAWVCVCVCARARASHNGTNDPLSPFLFRMGGRYTEILEFRGRGDLHAFARGSAASLDDVTRGVVRACHTGGADAADASSAESLWYCQKLSMYKKVFQPHRSARQDDPTPELLWSCALPHMDAVVTQCNSPVAHDGIKLWGLAEGDGWATFVPPDATEMQDDQAERQGPAEEQGACFARMRPVPVAGGRAVLCGTLKGTLALYSAARAAGTDQEEYDKARVHVAESTRVTEQEIIDAAVAPDGGSAIAVLDRFGGLRVLTQCSADDDD